MDWTRPLRPADRVAAGLLMAVLLMGTYHLVAEHMAASAAPMVELPTAVDGWVPFWAGSSLVYLGIYPHALTPLFVVEDRRVLARGAAAYLALVLGSVPVWLLWPVTVPRAPVEVDGLFTWGVALTRAIDPPTNCFPSMHVAETVLSALLCGRVDRRLRGPMLAGAALIWWSTLAMDQHWFVDGLVGALLAVGADRLAFDLRPLPPEALRPGPRWRLALPIALYAALFTAAASPWWTGAGPSVLEALRPAGP
jgi:membrane-associated phospholipid phosphatase